MELSLSSSSAIMPTSCLSPHAAVFEFDSTKRSIATKSAADFDNRHQVAHRVPMKGEVDQNQPPNKPIMISMSKSSARQQRNCNKNRARTDNRIKIVNQNAQGWDDSKMEETITIMETCNIEAYLLQGTCMAGNWEKMIERDSGIYLILHHNHNWLGSENGVAIILSPTLTEAYDRAGRSKSITTGSDSVENFYGRFIGIWLSFPNINPYGKKIKGELKIFLASAHHPNDPLEYEEFNDKLAELLLEAEPYDRNLAEIMLEVDSPYKSSCRLIGHNINANVGARDCEEVKCILGPNSIDNLDTKGILARNFMLSQNLRVLNTYFKNRSRRHTSSMKNIITSSMSLFKKVQNCYTCQGLYGTESATVADISLTSIKHTGGKNLAKRAGTINRLRSRGQRL